MTPASYASAEALGLSASDELDNNNGYGYFAALDALIVTERPALTSTTSAPS